MEIYETDKELLLKIKKIQTLPKIKLRTERLITINTDIPDNSGIYFLFNEKEELLYIGLSKSIIKRMYSHSWRGEAWFYEANCISYILYDKEGLDLEIIEAIYIYIYHPKHNSSTPLNIKHRDLFKSKEEIIIKKISGEAFFEANQC